jgi:hypothetical protein
MLPVFLGTALLLLVSAGLIVAFSPLRSRLAPPTASSTRTLSNAIASALPIPKPSTPLPLATPFVANPSKKTYHKADSNCVKRMLAENQIPIESVAKAESEGYHACGNCFRK